VRRFGLFGSALSAAFDPVGSDLDFVVEFLPMPPPQHAKAYFGLLTELENLFGKTVDLVERTALKNPYIRQEVEATQETLYAA
jgi:predicted nucleotidyltransferase